MHINPSIQTSRITEHGRMHFVHAVARLISARYILFTWHLYWVFDESLQSKRSVSEFMWGTFWLLSLLFVLWEAYVGSRNAAVPHCGGCTLAWLALTVKCLHSSKWCNFTGAKRATEIKYEWVLWLIRNVLMKLQWEYFGEDKPQARSVPRKSKKVEPASVFNQDGEEKRSL